MKESNNIDVKEKKIPLRDEYGNELLIPIYFIIKTPSLKIMHIEFLEVSRRRGLEITYDQSRLLSSIWRKTLSDMERMKNENKRRRK